jgi:hypothetical protein
MPRICIMLYALVELLWILDISALPRFLA